MNFGSRMAGLGVATALVFAGGAASAATTITITPTPGTVTGTTPYTPGEVVDFKFTIAPGYTWSFADVGFGGTFPIPTGSTASGGSGSFTEVFGPEPYKGTVAFELTTAPVPEPAVWSLMLLGLGGLGAALRLNARKGALALA